MAHSFFGGPGISSKGFTWLEEEEATWGQAAAEERRRVACLRLIPAAEGHSGTGNDKITDRRNTNRMICFQKRRLLWNLLEQIAGRVL